MTETQVGREPIQIVEIRQPLCENTFGSAPCTATGTGDTKCYNTRSTCQDTANFALGTPLSLFFSTGKVADRGVEGVPYLIPSLLSVSTTPTKINMAVSDRNVQGLGNRAVCSITFSDHPHSDRRVDPYVTGRSWNPLSADRGSFWTRWKVRNIYRTNIVLVVYEGYAGQTLAEMSSRQYFMQSVTGPGSGGKVTIQGKDILTKLEERKAQVPLASPGVLYSSIGTEETSFVVANAVVADYPSSGTLRINDEIMTYTSTQLENNGLVFSGIERGTDYTAAATHDVDDDVQACVRYTEITLYDLLVDLLNVKGGIDTDYLDLTGWTTEIDNYLSFVRLNTLLPAPTAVTKLLTELQEQLLFYMWWDEREAKVKLKSIRGFSSPPPTLTDTANILEGSLAVTDLYKNRISQLWVDYKQIDFTKKADDPEAYSSGFVLADLASETPEQHGEPSIRKIYARWLNKSIYINTLATRLLRRNTPVPQQCEFQLDAKDRQYGVGDTVYLDHHLLIDEFGNRKIEQWTIISYEENKYGHSVKYVAENTNLYGKIFTVLEDPAVDYPGAASAAYQAAYIGDSDGLLSDGNPSARIT